jgi:siroheme synthase-like protein
MMGYFPFFVEIQDKPCLVVGGGTVALRKVEKLLPFGPAITVVAPEICKELLAIGNVKIHRRSFADSDLDGMFMVISATNDAVLNGHIFALCREKQIPVNTVDDMEKCGFLFPALVHKDSVTVGISTAGSSPLYARFLREQTEALLDERILSIGAALSRFRPVFRKRLSTETQRKAAAERLLQRCLMQEKLPDDDEILSIIKEVECSYEA